MSVNLGQIGLSFTKIGRHLADMYVTQIGQRVVQLCGQCRCREGHSAGHVADQWFNAPVVLAGIAAAQVQAQHSAAKLNSASAKAASNVNRIGGGIVVRKIVLGGGALQDIRRIRTWLPSAYRRNTPACDPGLRRARS